jgi:hypothetical protein
MADTNTVDAHGIVAKWLSATTQPNLKNATGIHAVSRYPVQGIGLGGTLRPCLRYSCASLVHSLHAGQYSFRNCNFFESKSACDPKLKNPYWSLCSSSQSTISPGLVPLALVLYGGGTFVPGKSQWIVELKNSSFRDIVSLWGPAFFLSQDTESEHMSVFATDNEFINM